MSKSDSIERIQPCPSFPGYSASANGEIFSHWNRTGHGTGNGSSTWIDAGFSKKLKQRPNAGGLAALGFAHVATEKAAKLYRLADLPAIYAAMVRHIEAVQAKQAA